MGFAGKVEWIEPQTSNSIALIGVEFDLKSHPTTVVHTDITTTGGNE